MAEHTPAESAKPKAPDITWHGFHSLEERENMIREAAYYRYLEHGCCDGHDLDDWFEAETELEHGTTVPEAQVALPGAQQSSVHGAAQDDELKRMVRQHPHKAIPAVESIEASEAPSKE